MSMTMEQVVTQLQQELFTLGAQVAAESGLADAVRAINKSRQLKFGKTHRCERPWSSEGLHWLRGGFPTVVDEDGGILRWCDHGV